VGFEVGERVGFMPASNTCRERFPFSKGFENEKVVWILILVIGF
jgi:hypothetical protein